MRRFILCGLLVWGVASAGVAGEGATAPLMADNFEAGLSGQWLEKRDCPVVEEGGNHFVRLTTANGARPLLLSPPLKSFKPEEAEKAADALDRYQVYELSFRFRLSELPKFDGKVMSFFLVRAHLNSSVAIPNQGVGHYWYLDAKGQVYMTEKHGPRLHDGKTMRRFQDQNIEFQKPGVTFVADREWHTYTMQLEDDRVAIAVDGKVIFDGRDECHTAGGFSFVGVNPAAHAPKDAVVVVDLDDVVARPIDGITLVADKAPAGPKGGAK